MPTTTFVSPGMTISLEKNFFRVESSIKVSAPKGAPFVKTKLRNLATNEIVEKNFKLDQPVEVVSLVERSLEFLYLEGKDYLFLDIDQLEKILVPSKIIGDKVNYLKEGIEVKGHCYGNTIFSIELPQFLELMVSRVESNEEGGIMSGGTKTVVLETGARIEAPPFIEVGDIIKVDTKSNEYIQRV